MSSISLRACVGLAAFASLAASQDATVSFAPAPMASQVGALSQVLTSSFIGVGIEPSNLFDFTGADTPNELSITLMTNLANYSGGPPYIRLGGNAQDTMIFQQDFDEFYIERNPNPVGQGGFASDGSIFGPRYFEALDRFPVGTPVTFGLNMGYDGTAYGGYLDLIVAEAEAARSSIHNVDLRAFEIGNEPDLYGNNGFRTGTWDGQVYGQQWAERAMAIWEQVLRPNNLPSNFFEPGATANTIGNSFQISILDTTNISTSPVSGSSIGLVGAWSQHDYYYYIGVSNYSLTLDYLMDLSTTPAQFSAWAQQVQQAFATPYPYVLREMASAGPVGIQGISDTFGATLWTLNFFLYTAGLNISSVNLHMTTNSWAAPWQPVDLPRVFSTPPHVRTTYYAFVAMAQLIGTSCTTQVVGLPVAAFPPGYEGRLAVYTTYQAGALASIVCINSKQANATQTPKGTATFAFSLPALAGQSLYLSTLTADGADSTNGTTFNGLSFEISPNGAPNRVNGTVASVVVPQGGAVTVTVRDSQAVVANVGRVLGSDNTTRGSACASAASATRTGTGTATSGGSGAAPTYSVSVVSGTSAGKNGAVASATPMPIMRAAALAVMGGVIAGLV